MKKQRKINFILRNEQICKISESDKHIHYTCKGISGKIYQIIYFKQQERWKCECKNIKICECYHISCAKALLESGSDGLVYWNKVPELTTCEN